MGLKVVMPGMLGTALGDESRLIFGEYSFFISFLCEHPFVGNRDGADWFIDEHPSPHAPELGTWVRSEEHTSELQSHSDLVCRLLLEKKKRINRYTSVT